MAKKNIQWKELAKRGLLVLLGLVVFASFVPEGAMPVYAQGGEDSSEVGGTGEGVGAAGTSGNTGAETGNGTQSTGTDTAGTSAAGQSTMEEAASSGAEATSGSGANETSSETGSSAGAAGAEGTGTGVSGAASQAAAAPQAPAGVQGAMGGLSVDPPVEIKTLTVPATFTTTVDQLGVLVVSGSYFVNDPDGAAGTTITITIHHTLPHNFFLAPDVTELAGYLPAGAANPQVVSTGEDISIIFDLVSGTQNSETSFTFNIPYDHAQDGWGPTGTIIATVTATAEKNDETSTQARDIKATAGTKSGPVLTKTPVGDAVLDVAHRLFIGRHYHNNGTNWRLVPGTEMKLVFTYPSDAEVIITANAAGSTVVHNPEAGTITWTYGIANEDGIVMQATNPAAITGYNIGSDITILFPSSKFSADTMISLSACVEAQYYGTTVVDRSSFSTLSYTLLSGGIHLAENRFEVDGVEIAVPIESPDMLSRSSGIEGIVNSGDAPIPELCVSWINDTGSKKAMPFEITSLGAYTGTKPREKYVFTVWRAATGTQETKIVYTTGGIKIASNVPLQTGDYIERIDIYFIVNTESNAQLIANPSLEKRELPLGAQPAFKLNYKSWPDGKFPDGTPIQHEDSSTISFELTWKGEAKPETHTSPQVTTEGTGTDTVYKLVSADKVSLHVRYLLDCPTPRAYYSIDAGQGQFLPGGTIKAKVNFHNVSYMGYPSVVTSSVWREPVILMFPPDIVELDLSQPLQVYKNPSSPVLIGDVTTETVTINGKQGYRFTMPSVRDLPRTDIYNSANIYFIPVNFVVQSGITAGSYKLSKRSTSTFQATSGLLLATSETPNNLAYPPNVETNSNYYDDSMLDLDGNAITTYLYCPDGGSFTVAVQKDLQVSAQLYNDTAGEDGTGAWQSVNTAGAHATVPIGGTGQFRLEITNQGNTYIGGLELLDILPFAGDATVLGNSGAGTARGSAWAATLQSLSVVIQDSGGNDITGDFPGNQVILCKLGDPSYSKTGGIVTTGTAALTTAGNQTTNHAEAKSFLFRLDTTKRLPPGAKIIITGTVQAPDGATIAQMDTNAYNSFAVGGTSYTAATGGTADNLTPYEPASQLFRLTDPSTATLSGNVFKDFNMDGVWNSAAPASEPGYAGATVELYALDAGNDPLASPYRTATTGADGSYTFAGDGADFTGIRGGSYRVKITVPDSWDASLPFAITGSAMNPTTGFSSVVTVQPMATAATGFDIGLKAMGEITIEYRLNTAAGTKVGEDVVSGYYALNTAMSLTPGTTAGTAIPAEYEAKDPLVTVTSECTLRWSETGLKQTVVFLVRRVARTLTLDGNGSTDTPMADVSIREGETVTLPANTYTLANSVFLGWDEDAGAETPTYTDEDSFTLLVNADATLYAIWGLADCIVTFDTQGGTPVPVDQSLLPGALVVKPATDPAKTGYSFKGWYTAATGGDTWDFAQDTAPIGGTTLYAQYLPVAYKLTFDYNGAGPNATKNLYYQDPIAKPTDPTRTGYAFGGWFDEQNTVWNFTTGTMPARDLTLKAKWTLKAYTVTYVSEGATLDTKTVNYGALVPSLTPSRGGYTFQHWVLQGTVGAWNFAKDAMPNNDITLVAVWQEVPAPVPTSSSAASSSGSASRSVSSSSVASSSVASVPVVTSTESVPPAPASTSSAPQPTSGVILSPTLSEAFSNQSGNPITDIFNGRVPTGGLDVVSAWSFVSLLLGVLGFFLSVLLLVTGLAKKRRGDDEQDSRYTRETGDDGAVFTGNETDKTGTRARRPLALWLLSIFAGLLPGALFLLLDDISQPMVWFNRWTLLIAAVFAGFAFLAAIYLAVKKRRGADEQQDADKETEAEA